LRQERPDKQKVSLAFLFWTFFKVGSYSFGGYMSLIATVRKDLVERKKIILDEDVLNGLSLASFLPGPVAVNTVVSLGYLLRGIVGALTSLFGVILPTYLLVLAFSIIYFQPGMSHHFDYHITYIMPIIVAIIIDVGIKMSKKQLKTWSQGCISLATSGLTLFVKNVYVIPVTLIFAGSLGFFLFGKNKDQESNLWLKSGKPVFDFKRLVVISSVALLALLTASYNDGYSDLLDLGTVFSGMSLTLFGGGYVIIPVIENTLVHDLAWVSKPEFNAAISISQITPGPILISSAFIGYKVAGIAGSLAATLAVFVPSGMLMILFSEMHDRIKESSILKAILTGIRASVIGLIFSAAISIGIRQLTDGETLAVFMISLAVFLWTKIHPVFLILSVILLSLIV